MLRVVSLGVPIRRLSKQGSKTAGRVGGGGLHLPGFPPSPSPENHVAPGALGRARNLFRNFSRGPYFGLYACRGRVGGSACSRRPHWKPPKTSGAVRQKAAPRIQVVCSLSRTRALARERAAGCPVWGCVGSGNITHQTDRAPGGRLSPIPR